MQYYHLSVFIVAKLIECYCGSGGNIQRINSVMHWYFHGEITVGYCFVRKSVTLCSHNNSEFFFICQSRIIDGKRIISTEPFYAYLKIAEGCDNCCTYCAIPKIRGKMRSRKIEDCVNEAKELAAKIEGKKVEIKAKAGANGKLFGSITSKEIAAELGKMLGITVDKKKLTVKDIKNYGEYTATIKLFTDISATFTVAVIA